MPLDIFDAFATDADKELNGVDVPLGGGTSIKIARANNRRYNEELLKEYDKYEVSIKALPDDEAGELDTTIICRVVARTILLGWENLKYKGEFLDYSEENAAMLLEHKDFRIKVMSLASQLDLFKAKKETKTTKK